MNKLLTALLLIIGVINAQIPNPNWREIGAQRICDSDSTILNLNSDGSLFVTDTGTSNNARYIVDGNDDTLQLDDYTRALVTIGFVDHKINRGVNFMIAGFDTLGDGDTLVFAVSVPDTTRWPHMTFNIGGTGGLNVTVWEDATIASGAGGNVNQTRSGTVSQSSKIILKQNSTTVFKITSIAATNIISYSGVWFEHINR